MQMFVDAESRSELTESHSQDADDLLLIGLSDYVTTADDCQFQHQMWEV